MENDNVKKLVETRSDAKRLDGAREKIELSEGRLATWDSSNQDRIFQMQMQIQQNQQNQQNQKHQISASDSKNK